MSLFTKSLAYDFKDASLLERSLTHRSVSSVRDEEVRNNQRLEFLGDSVLGLCIADLLFKLYPDEAEGDLAKRHAALVCGEQLAKMARCIGLADALILSSSEAESGGRDNDSNLEDACEALIGALYLDGGLEVAREFIYRHLEAVARATVAPPQDPKTALQEWVQSDGLPLPKYTVLEQTGPSHAPQFTVQVSVEGLKDCVATASSKKAAEREAAQRMIDKIN